MYPGRNIEKTATAREKVVLATINKGVRFKLQRVGKCCFAVAVPIETDYRVTFV